MRASPFALGIITKRMKNFLEQGILEQASVSPDVWLEIKMLVENCDFYAFYAHLKASVIKTGINDFMKKLRRRKHVVIFGSGYVGSCAYCMLRNNGIENVAAFCEKALCSLPALSLF